MASWQFARKGGGGCNAPDQAIETPRCGCLLGTLDAAVTQQVHYVFGDEPEGARVRQRRALLEQGGAALEAVIARLHGTIDMRSPGDARRVGSHRS